jgi:hypothetical protein
VIARHALRRYMASPLYHGVALVEARPETDA